jgi:TRAP-type C4-dicarboxylate transport system permease small subunit
MLGIGLASSAGTHLRPRFFDGLVPKRHDAGMNRLADLLTAAFCGYFAWLGVITVGEALAQGDVNPELRWPIWPFQAVIPLAFWIACLRHALFALFPALAPRPVSPEQAELAAHQASDGAPIVSEEPAGSSNNSTVGGSR